MKKLFLSIIASIFIAVPAGATIEHLLPRVKNIEERTDCLGFNLQRSVSIEDATGSELLRDVLIEAGATIVDSSDVCVAVEIVESISGAFNHNLEGFPDEAYSIAIDENSITIKALNETGVIRAAQTLAQLATGTSVLQSYTITDWPAFKLRGLMHDVGRSFISIEELKKELRLLSQFKVNTFHWHLTENQAWRFEVRAYPELTSSKSMTRFAGSFYTQEQVRDLLATAKKYGITVIPEIDMPGHSAAYERAMGHAMQTSQGKAELQTILEEVAEVFADSPYIHIGGDEVTITDDTFLDTMIDKLHSLGKKVVCWNRINGVNIAEHDFDMTQMWATAGTKVSGIPNIDCRYNYVNHFDVFADLVGIYKSQIYYEQQGTDDVAGTITAIWNDRKTPGESDIIAQNNLYATTLASAERGWVGGGKQYIETGGTMLPNSGDEFDEFADWERRFLLHKSLTLKDEPIPYVKQTNIHWYVTEMFDNGGDETAMFAPEVDLTNQTWGVTPVTGAGIYLRHTWGGTVPGLYGNAPINRTAYAYTYIYSPCEQTLGALIEFQNYGRSENDKAPDAGKWDRKGSRLWLNGEEILPPVWGNTGKAISSEVDLLNENFSAREPLEVALKEGWNKLLIKLPYVSADGVRLNKWMWTFALVDCSTGEAAEVRYSPTMSIDDNAETVASLIAEARSIVTSVIKDMVGYYPSTELDKNLVGKLDEAEATLSINMTYEERQTQLSEIWALLDAFTAGYAASGINLPKTEVYYNMYTPLRNSKYAASVNGKLGSTSVPAESAAWKFENRSDGKYNIINYLSNEYVASGTYNQQINLSTSEPSTGWEVKAADTPGYVIIVNGSQQFNQSNNSDIILNWGSATNTSDAGCKYMFLETDYSDDASVAKLRSLIYTVKSKVEEVIGEDVGYYSSTDLDKMLMEKIAYAESVIETLDDVQLASVYSELQSLYNAFLLNYATCGVNQPQSGIFYNLSTPLRNTRYATASGGVIVGSASPTEESAWTFVKRGDSSFDIQNYVTDEFVSPLASYNSQLTLTADSPESGWEVDAADEIGYVIIRSGSAQFNQTKSDLNFKVYNWGGGTNVSDDGCKYVVAKTEFVKEEIKEVISSLTSEPMEVYDLRGQKLRVPTHGINIINGRKVIMK